MPRSNRPRQSRRGGDEEERDLSQLLSGWRRTEERRGVSWNVQPITTPQATKVYRCPGCGGEIGVGIAHLVIWRADGILGDSSDLAARRHWHTHCWKTA